jgi:hypothetical protein
METAGPSESNSLHAVTSESHIHCRKVLLFLFLPNFLRHIALVTSQKPRKESRQLLVYAELNLPGENTVSTAAKCEVC